MVCNTISKNNLITYINANALKFMKFPSKFEDIIFCYENGLQCQNFTTVQNFYAAIKI